MDYKNKKKLTSVDKRNIQNRFEMKFEEFKTKTVDELKEMFNKVKMSNTDKQALICAVGYLNDKEEEIKVEIKEDNIEGE